ncbi:50S ribosomal protein L23 [Candidatus Nomurabacteria bacterium]|nr:50S ribosomal protein L23 [Candidatus Nomurabacteria bacterium]
MAESKTQSKKTKEKKVPAKKPRNLLLRAPRITEKTARASERSVYVFDVAPSATKNEIAKAFEASYKHKPLKVSTLIKKPKARFRRTAQGSQLGFGPLTKKAYVYLKKGTTIDVM